MSSAQRWATRERSSSKSLSCPFPRRESESLFESLCSSAETQGEPLLELAAPTRLALGLGPQSPRHYTFDFGDFGGRRALIEALYEEINTAGERLRDDEARAEAQPRRTFGAVAVEDVQVAAAALALSLIHI